MPNEENRMTTAPARLAEVLEQIGRLNRVLVKDEGRWRLLVGGRGVGKTTCICKWLTREVLKERRRVEVMRLGAHGDKGDELGLVCDALKVAVRGARDELRTRTGFIDVPGVDWRDEAAVKGLRDEVNRTLGIGKYEVYVVLNAAYEREVLRNQLRAFSVFDVKDLIFTHGDEVTGERWREIAKESGYSVAYVSGGWEVPGAWEQAEAAGAVPPWLRASGAGRGFAEVRMGMQKA